MGTRNAAVFPLPVLAMATTSLPSRMTGIVCHGKRERHEKAHEKHQIQNDIKLVTHLSLDGCRNIVALLHDAFIDRVAKTCAMGKMDLSSTSQSYVGLIGLMNGTYPWTESLQTFSFSCSGHAPSLACPVLRLTGTRTTWGNEAAFYQTVKIQTSNISKMRLFYY